MKTKLFLLAILACCATATANAQKKAKKPAPQLEMDSVSGKWMYRRIIQADTMSADKIFDLALQWVPRAYRSATHTIQYQDKATGKIIVKGFWKDAIGTSGSGTWHVLIIETKAGRLRATLTDFVLANTTLGDRPLEGGGYMMKRITRENIASDSEKLIESLAASLVQSAQQADDRW